MVVITAARPGEGKTTTSVALARSAAMNGERVLLIDCDIRQPSLGKVFRAEGAPGVTELLLGQAVLERIVRRDHLTSLDYIPAGAAEIHSLGLFMSEAMAGLLERVRRDYDLVVLDAPPALAMADARVSRGSRMPPCSACAGAIPRARWCATRSACSRMRRPAWSARR